MRFAEKLNNLMQEANMSNYRLAKLLNVHQTTVANWRAGKTEPRAELLYRIFDIFNDTKTSFFDFDISLDRFKNGEISIEDLSAEMNMPQEIVHEIINNPDAFSDETKQKVNAVGNILSAELSNTGHADTKQSTKKALTENDERDELIDAIMTIVKKLSPEQKEMLLAQLRGLAGEK